MCADTCPTWMNPAQKQVAWTTSLPKSQSGSRSRPWSPVQPPCCVSPSTELNGVKQTSWTWEAESHTSSRPHSHFPGDTAHMPAFTENRSRLIVCATQKREWRVGGRLLEHSEHLCPRGRVSSVYSMLDKSPSCPRHWGVLLSLIHDEKINLNYQREALSKVLKVWASLCLSVCSLKTNKHNKMIHLQSPCDNNFSFLIEITLSHKLTKFCNTTHWPLDGNRSAKLKDTDNVYKFKKKVCFFFFWKNASY